MNNGMSLISLKKSQRLSCFTFCNVLHMGVSGPSPLTESTDSMIKASTLLTSLLATLFIMTFSGRSIVLATARTISLACCLVGQSNRLYRTVCFLVQRRSSSSARRTVGSLSSSAEEKYRSRSKEAWSGVASSPVSCWKGRGKEYNNTLRWIQSYTYSRIVIVWFNDCVLDKSGQIANPMTVIVNPIPY